MHSLGLFQTYPKIVELLDKGGLNLAKIMHAHRVGN